MSEEHIIAQAAPTLAGIKTGSLFSCPDEGRAALTEEQPQLTVRDAGALIGDHIFSGGSLEDIVELCADGLRAAGFFSGDGGED